MIHYNYFQEHYKIIAIDLSKQQVIDADSKLIQQINFAGSLEQNDGTIMFFIIKEAKETFSDFLQGTVRVF